MWFFMGEVEVGALVYSHLLVTDFLVLGLLLVRLMKVDKSPVSASLLHHYSEYSKEQAEDPKCWVYLLDKKFH